MNPKHPLFLTYYNKITAITGSVPPSPREKASAQRPTIFSYGNAGHFRLYRIILDPVGANPRVRPTILSCPTVFIKKTAASYPWAHTSVRPYVVKEAWRCFSHIWRIGHACFAQKRFSVQKPSPEEKVARHLSSMVICMVTLCNRSSVKSTRSFVVPCRKRASDALPKSDGQQEDRLHSIFPCDCRDRACPCPAVAAGGHRYMGTVDCEENVLGQPQGLPLRCQGETAINHFQLRIKNYELNIEE